MRHTILSGYLAAKSFIDGSDYDMLWKRNLKPMLASLINRYLFERFGHLGYEKGKKGGGYEHNKDCKGKRDIMQRYDERVERADRSRHDGR